MAESDLLSRARATRVVVIGGGVAGLVAARECARVGFAVTLFESAEHLGGAVADAELDGLRVDAVADSYAPGAQALIDDLGLGDAVVPLATDDVWITGLPGAAPVPADALAGIPANPWADDVRRLIGWRGAWRAYLDKLRPPLTIGRQANLGALVGGRMGARVLDRLVAPLTRGVYGIEPSDVDADAAVPGLSTALTRLGSLSGAVGDLLVDAPDKARRSLRGGMTTLVDALAAELADYAVDVRVGVRVEKVGRGFDTRATQPPEGTRASRATQPPGGARPARATSPWTAEVAGEEPIEADAVVVATPRTEAHRLLAGAGVVLPRNTAPAPAPADVVTLLVDAPALDGAPRGGAAYPIAADAASVVHATAAWEWLAVDAGPGRHVLRVRLPAETAPDDDVIIARAVAEVAAAFAVPLTVDAVIAAHRARVEPAAPASVLGHADRAEAVRRAVAKAPGLTVVGAWVAGAGIARTVADAVAETDRMRHALLWDSGDENHPAPDVNP
ncbi:protoporphyrinogen/coproporphyrinogen oxidase [Microbacterium telephonicum]|uniref:Oxygen-dependent protoporphyrinogen oxidase n=1 Tax=Microbacterium telephonicum TaxID=1714841 RepID=A0A498BUR9_9MICO|nr:FAD-dependent oxidoreductase [Microbacterium telephonicum]RLK46657.1 oxygen-dependent protoporphyrinogen oxidase [Microbacterium telephonicum]